MARLNSGNPLWMEGKIHTISESRMSPSRNDRRKGFTLIELLVVIAIIAILIGLLLPAVQKVREAAARMKCSNNLKQIGLALHNYEGTYGYMPPYGFDFTYNPNTANPLGDQRQGHCVLGMILPFMEQQNVLNALHPEWSVIDPNSWPPNWGPNPAASATVKSYVCPSSPEPQIDYGPYFVSLGLPDKGPFVIGATDYSPVRGARDSFRNACAPSMPTPTNESGVLGVFGQWTPDGMKRGKAKFANITDGLSNTIMFTEDAGRHQVYAKGRMVTPNSPGQIGWTLNAAYFDYNIKIEVRGFSNDGLIPDGGCCVINCNNVNQFYSFHTGGVNALRADGSVNFLRDSTNPGVLAAMITRAGGEVFSDN